MPQARRLKPLLAGLALSLAAAVATADERVIQLAIEADAAMNEFEVQNKFTTAREATPGFNFREITVEPLDPASFVLVSSLVRRGILEAAPAVDDPRGVLVEPLRGQDNSWYIDLRDPDAFLESLEVTVVDTETRKQRVERYQPAPRDERAQPLRYHSPGTYILALSKGLYPQSAVLNVSRESGAGAEPKVDAITIGWPDVGRCYLVTLRGVRGEEQDLFKSLKDPAKVGNAIKDITPTKAELIVGSFRERTVGWKFNLVMFPYLVPLDARPRRLWLRFPLTEAEEKAVVAELDAQLAPPDGFKKLPAWLDERKLPKGTLVKPGTDKWLEIPVDPSTRSFEVAAPIDTRAWRQLVEKEPDRVGDRAILVWEFQTPGKPADREVIRVGGERYQRERFGWWLAGLPKAPLE